MAIGAVDSIAYYLAIPPPPPPSGRDRVWKPWSDNLTVLLVYLAECVEDGGQAIPKNFYFWASDSSVIVLWSDEWSTLIAWIWIGIHFVNKCHRHGIISIFITICSIIFKESHPFLLPLSEREYFFSKCHGLSSLSGFSLSFLLRFFPLSASVSSMRTCAMPPCYHS